MRSMSDWAPDFPRLLNGTFVKIDRTLVTNTTAAMVSGELQFDLQRVIKFADLINGEAATR